MRKALICILTVVSVVSVADELPAHNHVPVSSSNSPSDSSPAGGSIQPPTAPGMLVP